MTYPRWIALGWLCWGLASGVGANPRAFKRAQQADKNGDFLVAAREYFKVVRFPGAGRNAAKMSQRAEFGLAQALYKLEFYHGAASYLTEIVQRGSGKDNPYFRRAFDILGRLNGMMSIGRGQVLALLTARLKPSEIPGEARGFYFYFRGLEAFDQGKYKIALSSFKRVQPGSGYYLKAMFHRGAIGVVEGQRDDALEIFRRVMSLSEAEINAQWLQELAQLNIARIHYENGNFNESLRAYAEISRDSDNWLQAIFESSWAFFLMDKPNNTLGNIHTLHAPFFDHRFFPESYILQAITYLKMCRFDEAKAALTRFKQRYSNVVSDTRRLMQLASGRKSLMFQSLYEYRSGKLKRFTDSWPVLDSVSRADAYKQAGYLVRAVDRELELLDAAPSTWQDVGLVRALVQLLKEKKKVAIEAAGEQLFGQVRQRLTYLEDLIAQTQLIAAELLLGKVDSLRAQLNVATSNARDQYIGGLSKLELGQRLEYWPFEGEYWEDELGGYVYNIASQCRK